MILIRRLHEFPADFGRVVLVLGTFDGFHLGHRALIEKAKELAEDKRKVVIAGFHPPPGLFFNESVRGNVLTLPSERMLVLDDLPVDCHILMHFNRGLSDVSACDFLTSLKTKTNFDLLVAGSDHAFGFKRQGNKKFMEEMSLRMQYKLHTVEDVCLDGRPIRSSYIRNLLSQGMMEEASRFLGRFYTILGRVKPGKALGRLLGVPTANIIPPPSKLLPPDGVYSGFVKIDIKGISRGTNRNEENRKAVVYIGTSPTTGGNHRAVEVHIPGYSGSLYGKRIAVSIVKRVRPDICFNSREELKVQILKDIETIMNEAPEVGL